MEIGFIDRLKERLRWPLPGIEAQYEMAHIAREKVKPEELNPWQFKPSAVLLLLIPRKNDFFIPLTERNDYKGWHSKQISLPGGKYDVSDTSLEDTAIRECYEEIGIRENIEVIGKLTPVFIPVSKFMVNPFIGISKTDRADYIIDKNEVNEIIELSLTTLRDPSIIKQTTVEPATGIKLKTPYFDVQGKVVWGATAMILNEFKSLLKDL